MKKLREGGAERVASTLKTQAYSEEPEVDRQKRGRTFIDVVRKGGKRRGYVTTRRTEDNKLEIGFSLCGLKDRFNGKLGLDIAFKRGVRLWSRDSYFSTPQGDFVLMNGDMGSSVTVPRTLIPRILNAVERVKEGRDTEPAWVKCLRTEFTNKSKQTSARKKGGS